MLYMAEKKLYNSIGLLKEAKRYKTSQVFLKILLDHFYPSKRMMVNGLGARLTAVSLALTDELWGVDVNQGSIDRAEAFIEHFEQYEDELPFKTEFEFIQEQGLTIDAHYEFLLLPAYPNGLKEQFDSELACELFLHLPDKEIKEILARAYSNLGKKGKLIFTIYHPGKEHSLDNEFERLGSVCQLQRHKYIQDGVINIKKLVQHMKPDLAKSNLERFWLDLEQVRVIPESSMEQMCKDYDFKIIEKAMVHGGMFSFADRLVYVCEK